MSDEKEIARLQVRQAKYIRSVLGVIGTIVGYAVSYWFQPELLRAKCSLGDYFVHIVDVFKTKETALTALIVTGIVSALFTLLGHHIVAKAQLSAASVLSGEEMRQISDNPIVLGKIKEGEDNAAGSAKRIIKMLLIGLVMVFVFFVLLFVGFFIFSSH